MITLAKNPSSKKMAAVGTPPELMVLREERIRTAPNIVVLHGDISIPSTHEQRKEGTMTAMKRIAESLIDTAHEQVVPSRGQRSRDQQRHRRS